MPRHIKIPYECICCGYETFRKQDMIKHFYKLIKPCPKLKNNIDLTDEIKEFIITNRVFSIAPKDKFKPNTLISDFANLKIENAILKKKKR